MRKYDIDFYSILSQGHVRATVENEMLSVTSNRRLTTNFDKEDRTVASYIYLPHTYKLPLRIDLTAKIDSQGLYIFFGGGHINFGTPWSDNRRIDDISEPNCKPRLFHNHIPLNEFVDISIIYDLKAMQILVNGEERFYSEKEKYMKTKLFAEQNKEGYSLKIACYKRTILILKALRITEFDEKIQIGHADAQLPKPLTRNEAVPPGEKPQFDMCISFLPIEIQKKIIETDEFLRSLRPLKFKRQIEKYGNKITYLASEYGLSYTIYPSNDIMHHSLNWYIITNGKPELWHRKADLMEATLNMLGQNNPELAERLFTNLRECIACCKCIVKTPYEFNDKKKLTCHGTMEFKMSVPEFDDVQAFINTVNLLLGTDTSPK